MLNLSAQFYSKASKQGLQMYVNSRFLNLSWAVVWEYRKSVILLTCDVLCAVSINLDQ